MGKTRKSVIIDENTHRALREISDRLGVPMWAAVRYLVNDAIPRVRNPKQDDALGRLVLLKIEQEHPQYEPMVIGGENQGGF